MGTYTLRSDYPNVCPELSLKSNTLSKTVCGRIRDGALAHAESLLSRPMIMDINVWLQENISHYVEDIAESSSESAKNVTTEMALTLLSLDHMRSRNKYISTIEKWTSELGLHGRVMFCDKLIWILLYGSHGSLKVCSVSVVSRLSTFNLPLVRLFLCYRTTSSVKKL